MTDVIQLISGPRNISTALMYAFGNRVDTSVVDEPMYGYYLKTFDVDHPGKKEVLQSMTTDPQVAIRTILHPETETPHHFVKNMSMHLEGVDVSYAHDIKNIFLIRDPERLITSYAKVIENPTMRDIGLEKEWFLFKEVTAHSLKPWAVLDTGEVLKNPRKVLTQLCKQIDIPFSEEMLAWKAGPRKEDGIWAPYWYGSVHQSTGFMKQRSSHDPLPERLRPLYDDALPYYNMLYTHAIKA